MSIASIAVFGATGKTGRPFLERALQQYQVKALVRQPEKLFFQHAGLTVIQGDVLNREDVDRTIQGSQAVVSLLGHVKGSPADLQTQAIRYMIDAMQRHRVKRLVILTGGGVRDPEHDEPKFMDKAIVFIMRHLAGQGTKNALEDGIRHVELVKQTDLDWTVVRGPMLNEQPATGSYEVGYVGHVGGFKLTRADLADFLVKVIEDERYVRDMPFLANK